jgi:hypothetical protein
MLEIAISAGKIKQLAYILGVYLSDGNVSHYKVGQPCFRLNTIDEDFIKATQVALQQLLNRKINVRRNRDRRYKNYWYFTLAVATRPLCEWLETVTNKKQNIPRFAYDWPGDIKKELVAGLIDGEGYTARCRWTTDRNGKHYEGHRVIIGIKATDQWIYQLYSLLQGMGVKVNKIRREKPRKEWYKVPISFRINRQSFIDNGLYFKIKRKQNKLIPSETTCSAS